MRSSCPPPFLAGMIGATASSILSGVGDGFPGAGGCMPENTSTIDGRDELMNRRYVLSMYACERFACGSKSTARTFSSSAPTAWRPSNAAMVVLPTQPFRLMTATHSGPLFTSVLSDF